MRNYTDFSSGLKQYVGQSRLFKCPAPCPECIRAGYTDPVHRIDYVYDYVTHRAGYHNVADWLVQRDLEEILRREDCCYGYCCDCSCCCKKECCHDGDKALRKLERLERALKDINHELSRVRSEIC